VYDQRFNHAVYLPTIDDADQAFAKAEYARDLWRRLNWVLQCWLNVIHNGRVVAIEGDVDDYESIAWTEAEDDWIRLLYSPRVLDHKIAAFNALVQAVEDRPKARPRVTMEGTLGWLTRLRF